ncbi:ComEC/Rec2 family competence protein [Mesorhizobium sp. L48C026A00]|uniref:ComEC/Rec2 family competence protein n=1 Tax=Mesorhizobium sp. L48C026A00 TaxID=1287182 RepID=UPI0003CF9FE6|nr:MBL fold metallo-hydrolase [Mesorhizobium sp. L48C026A00]ESZ07399.1 hypothetical protein X737_34430 [Mesorhizobium sp. L48C026A00]
MFRVRMLPADDGDCLLLDYGTEDRQHHILIDGGRGSTYAVSIVLALKDIRARGERIDLLVLSHIDADHIEGLLPLIEDPDLPGSVAQVWFNGFDQLSDLEIMGPRQGDAFSDGLLKRAWPWNADFNGKAVAIREAKLPVIDVVGGMKITLLTPTMKALSRLRSDWIEYRQSKTLPVDPDPVPAGLEILGPKLVTVPGNVAALADAPDVEDRTVPNGSSIAFVAEFEGRRVLLAADALPSDLLERLRKLDTEELHLVKLSHHRSKANTTIPLVRAMAAKRIAISTSGARNRHPNPEAVARLIQYGPKELHFYFNYRTPYTEVWDSQAMRDAFGHECFFGEGVEMKIDV